LVESETDVGTRFRVVLPLHNTGKTGDVQARKAVA
jgi:hypothetical protein